MLPLDTASSREDIQVSIALFCESQLHPNNKKMGAMIQINFKFEPVFFHIIKYIINEQK